MGYIAAQRDSRGVPRVCGWVPRTHPTFHAHLTHIALFPCLALVMPFSRDTLTELSMTLTRLSGAKVGGFIPFGQGPMVGGHGDGLPRPLS